ncbi:CDK5RAP1-like protein [Hondaea fermentalgiana]|uniref:CDK5RAP1-like protein n=1 Tax=Hondaea fermentalgiana TaxID=2315210 RepID=A0A2R5G9F3_9STRA|nr:CDK5RAP1-like protein [Hondaea fermentalgiana]|eukprot:GBG27175.1 CDK5RAP1-like protein [Hondaea fermentalgiana]
MLRLVAKRAAPAANRAATIGARRGLASGASATRKAESPRAQELRRKLRKERIPLRAFIQRSSAKGESRVVNLDDPAQDQQLGQELAVPLAHEGIEDLEQRLATEEQRSYFIQTLGCAMNVADGEICASILEGAGYVAAEDADNADVVLVNTCAIREQAEFKALQQLRAFRKHKRADQQVGVLGCMAGRLRDRLLDENLVNVVAGPDGYRDLPRLLRLARGENQGMNVQLSVDETYADIAPVRRSEPWQAFISITRGCNNMCSYCIVPFTRGRERSREARSIVQEVEALSRAGEVKEVVLLGQNVNSYLDRSEEGETDYSVAPGFRDMFKLRDGPGVRFADLLARVAAVDPTIRVRFTSPHPKDFTDDVFHVMVKYPNICRGIHLPAQSGSTRVLESMRRGYTRESYLDLIRRAREIVGPDLELSTDNISGFCGETEEDHQDTLSLFREVRYDQAFMFHYSERESTHAYHKLDDDIPEDIKKRRLQEVIQTFRDVAHEKAEEQIGKVYEVLVEGPSRRDPTRMQGRTNGLRRCIITDSDPATLPVGSYVKVRVNEATAATLLGTLVE